MNSSTDKPVTHGSIPATSGISAQQPAAGQMRVDIHRDTFQVCIIQPSQAMIVGQTHHAGALLERYITVPTLDQARFLVDSLIPANIVDYFREAGESLKFELDLTPALAHLPWDAVFALLGASALAEQRHVPPNSFNAHDRQLRQVTSLSYDIASSTQLMREIGLERYSMALMDCHKQFAKVIQHWGGISDIPQGDDGIMCYFGTAGASELTIRNALQAAIELRDTAKALEMPVRIGIATGQVAINGDQFVGLSVHFAARLQTFSPVGSILVSEITHRLAEQQFKFSIFAKALQLKGFDSVGKAMILEAESSFDDSAPISSAIHAPLQGRETHMSALLEQWSLVAQSRCQMVEIAGEAGIGKSRLVTDFLNTIGHSKEAFSIKVKCFPEKTDRAFAPMADLVSTWLTKDTTAEQIASTTKLIGAIEATKIDNTQKSMVKHLLGIQESESLLPNHRQLMIEAMCDWLITKMEDKPACVVIEDIHWADASTIELFQSLQIRCRAKPLLLIYTKRQDHASPGGDPQQVFLTRLSREDSLAFIEKLDKENSLPRHIRQSIAENSDGVPLFLENCVQMYLERKDFLGENFERMPVPATLHDLLMNRLDRLGAHHNLAQMLSVFGREFDLSWVQTLTRGEAPVLNEDELAKGISTLLDSGLIQPTDNKVRGTNRLTFSHGLLHEIAYQSLWNIDRKRLHLAVARRVREQFPVLAEHQPETLADHFKAAEEYSEAFEWYSRAAKRYKQAQAFVESIAQTMSGRECLMQLPDTIQRKSQLMHLELGLAGQLIATRGYGNSAAGKSYQSALAIATEIGDKKSQVRAQLGLEAFHLMRADFGQAHAYIAQAQHTSRELNDPLTKAACHFALANILHHQGHSEYAIDMCNQCIAICRESSLDKKLVQSPEVMSLMYSSVGLWEIGQVELALARSQEGVELAKAIGQRLGLGQALGMHAMVLLWCGHTELALEASLEAKRLCNIGGYEMWHAHATIMQSLCMAKLAAKMQGNFQEALDLFDKGYERWTQTGTLLTRSFYMTLHAQLYLLIKKPELANLSIQEAEFYVSKHGEHYYEPEVLRIKGEVLAALSLVDGEKREEEVRECFDLAFNRATALGYRSLALRAGISQAKHFNDTDILREAFAQLPSGRQTRDQVIAQNILSRLDKKK